MPKIDVKSIEGQKVGEVELPDDIFSVPFNPFPIQEVVRMQLANRRRGTHKTKERSEVSGSTRKLYRQKGTGHARAGSIKSPLRRGGGTIFGPQPRDYSFLPPKKVRRKALCIALTQKLDKKQIEIVREFPVDEPKTKRMLAKLDPQNLHKKTLIILSELDEPHRTNLKLSLHNVPFCKILKPEGLNVLDLLYHQRVIFLEKSIPMITQRLGS